MSFLNLLRHEPRSIAFGFLYTFGSSPGQTFFISIFVPSIMASLAIGIAEFSALYALATVAAALALPFLGRIIDRVDLVHFGAATGLMLTIACAGIAAATGPVILLLSLFGLRLFGQGLMSHTAMTAAARYFDRDRGKALALANLGHAAGEALLPLAAVFLIALIGWRYSFLASGIVLGVLTAVTAAYQVRLHREFRFPASSLGGSRAARRKAAIWRIPYFWMVAPVMMAAPFTLTALIFHQGWIAQATGMSLALFAASFVAFALAQVPGTVIAGPLVDRFSGRRLLPFHLLPGILGIATLAGFQTVWAVLLYMTLTGLSNGFGGTLRNAAIAEMVDPAHMGAARSFATAMMVLSTAVGPAAFGLLIVAGFDVTALLWTAAAIFAATSILGLAANAGRLQANVGRD
ncbi:MAG: MFS transporter [Allosphingosinicella sp.]|uniref:MFS transporter n=1 Tax=Allosphingosinicella sp. TaxID=2823234 RepID=UPI00394ABE87